MTYPAGRSITAARQKLIIPTKAVTAASAPATGESASRDAGRRHPASGDGVKYTGETRHFGRHRPRAHGVSVGDIAVASNISIPQKIRPGMGDDPAPKSGRSGNHRQG